MEVKQTWGRVYVRLNGANIMAYSRRERNLDETGITGYNKPYIMYRGLWISL